jgi:hypothetical protein
MSFMLVKIVISRDNNFYLVAISCCMLSKRCLDSISELVVDFITVIILVIAVVVTVFSFDFFIITYIF